MKKLLLILMLSVSLVIISGCKVFTPGGPQSSEERTGRAKIENVEEKIAHNTDAKMESVATFAYGTDYALSKIDDPPKAVVVARDMNQRTMSIAGSPTLEKMKEMQATIDKLTSELATERIIGRQMLDAKDADIVGLQSESKLLAAAKQREINKYMVIAQEAAAAADAYKSELVQMDSWGGMGAVWYGLKKLFVRCAWGLGIGSVLFLILRFASMSNPIAASIFSIFNTIGSWFINGLAALFPKAIELAGHTATSLFSAYKNTMVKLVDSIQILKDRQAAIGDPNKKYTLDELLIELSKNMSDEDKKLVANVKQEIGYH